MFFTKKGHLVGLDLGSRTIKALQLGTGSKEGVLKSFGMVDLEEGAIHEGSIRNPDAVADALRRLFKEHDITEPNVAISIAGYSVIVKNIMVETMTEEQMQENLQVEAEQYLPFDVSDVYLDFQIIGESEEKEGQMKVVLVAAKRDVVDEYVSVVESADLNPVVMDVDAFALQNIYKFNYDAIDEVVALVDVGANKTSINILKNRTSELIRDVNMGGWQITQEIMSRVGCAYEEAEQIKKLGESAKLGAAELAEVFAAGTARWCDEIRRAIDFFHSTFSDARLNRILLSGGGAGVRGFAETLANETGTSVEILDPFQAFELDEKQLDVSYLKRIAPQAAICAGLALRKAGDK